METSQQYYQTINTPLAAYLYVSGLRLVKVDTAKNPTIFTFEQNNGIPLEELVSKWENGIAEGNVRAFYKTYKNLLKQIKNGSGEAKDG